MIDIRYLEKEDLFLIQTFILKEKKFFEKFFNLGWSYKNIKNHFHKENNISIGYFYNDILLGILIGLLVLFANKAQILEVKKFVSFPPKPPPILLTITVMELLF